MPHVTFFSHVCLGDELLYSCKIFVSKRVAPSVAATAKTWNVLVNSLFREEQLWKLRAVMVKTVIYFREQEYPSGSYKVEQRMFEYGDDPDPNYVLTSDNAKKILAIHQRLR